MKYILLILLSFSLNEAVAQENKKNCEVFAYLSAGLPSGSFGKSNFANVFAVNSSVLFRLNSSFRIGGDLGYDHFSASNPSINNINLIKTSFVARLYPSTLLRKILNQDISLYTFYLEGGIGHAFNNSILVNNAVNYNHLKIGGHIARFDLGLNLAGYHVERSVSNDLFNSYSVYLGCRF